MNVTYEIDSFSKDRWNDLFTFNIRNKDIDDNPNKKKKCKCDKEHCHCHHHHKPRPPFPPGPPFPPDPHHKPHHGGGGCKCDPKKTEQEIKKTQKEIERVRTEVLKEVVKLIGEQTDIDVNKIVNMVIKKQKPHEDNQTNNINKNQQDISDLNNITIWDKDTHFGG